MQSTWDPFGSTFKNRCPPVLSQVKRRSCSTEHIDNVMRYVDEIKANTTISEHSLVSALDPFELLHGLMLPVTNERWLQVKRMLQARGSRTLSRGQIQYRNLIEGFGNISLDETQVAEDTRFTISSLYQLSMLNLIEEVRKV
jgi:hypothetical protein